MGGTGPVDVYAIIRDAVSQSAASFKEISESTAEKAAKTAIEGAMEQMKGVAAQAVKQEIEPLQREVRQLSADVDVLKRQRTTGSSFGGTSSIGEKPLPDGVEVGGWVQNWKSPQETALLSAAATQHLNALFALLPAGSQAAVDMTKSRAVVASRLFTYKICFYLNTPNVRAAQSMKQALTDVIQQHKYQINLKPLIVSIKGTEEDRGLRRAAARCHSIVDQVNGNKNEYKVEYVKHGPKRGVVFYALKTIEGNNTVWKLASWEERSDQWDINDGKWVLQFPNLSAADGKAVLEGL